MRKIPAWLYIFSAFLSLVALGTIFQLVSSKVPENLTEDRSKEYVYSITGYVLPDTVDLIYSKRYWPEGSEPMTICSVFKLTDIDFIEIMNFNFLRKDEYANDAILADKGCNNFQDEREISNIHIQEGDHLRGYTIQVNNSDNLVMFEMYLYD